MNFTIIPVIDLRTGRVVHARGGSDRSRYPPLRSPLCPLPDPVMVAGALAGAARSDVLYLADLDAIAGDGDNAAAVQATDDAAQVRGLRRSGPGPPQGHSGRSLRMASTAARAWSATRSGGRSQRGACHFSSPTP